jgi:hypothetical protein
LLWLVRGLPGAVGVGFEFDDEIFRLTSRNLAAIGAPIALLHGDCRSLIGERRFPGRQPIVAPLAPPWGDALNPKSGLDLSQTKPPISEMIGVFERAYPENPILYVIETHERLAPEPLAHLRQKFDWSELEMFEVGGPIGRHGVLLGAQRWLGLTTKSPPREPRSKGRLQGRPSADELWSWLQLAASTRTQSALADHHHRRADVHPAIEVDRVHVAHADAA